MIFTLLEQSVSFTMYKMSRSFDHLMYHVTFWAACCKLRAGKYWNHCWNFLIEIIFCGVYYLTALVYTETTIHLSVGD